MKAILLATVAALIGVQVAAADDVTRVIAERLAATRRPLPQESTHTNGTVGLLMIGKRDLKGTEARGHHMAIAMSEVGDVVGVLLKGPSGVPKCDFGGFFDGACLTLSGCVSGTECL
jgi:hypothetical protein